MNIEVWTAFLLACIVISLSPGAGAVNTMSNGLSYGVRHSIPAILGLQLGYGAQFVIVAIGLGALLSTSSQWFELVKWLGVGYLLWLGIQKWRHPFISLQSIDAGGLDYRRRFWQAAFVNLTNPKATVFLVAFLPQFVDLGKPQLPQFTLMTVTGIAVDILVMLGYATLAMQLSKWLKNERHQRHANRLFGSMFMLAAVLMASY